jgi:acyl-CoA synthetase (AMP-forming)/AMP-acid ligase II
VQQLLDEAQASVAARLAHALEASYIPAAGQGLSTAAKTRTFGCVKAGVNRVPLNSRLSAQEQVRILQDSQCSILIFGADLTERARELWAALPELRCFGLGVEITTDGDFLATAERQPNEAPQIVVQPDDVVLTLYTSGTTGVLKAAQHTQASYAGICRNVLLNLFSVQPNASMLHSASLIHASGTFVLPFWLRGAKTVILPGFVPAAFLEAIERCRVTAVNLVPTMLQMLLESPDLDRTTIPLWKGSFMALHRCRAPSSIEQSPSSDGIGSGSITGRPKHRFALRSCGPKIIMENCSAPAGDLRSMLKSHSSTSMARTFRMEKPVKSSFAVRQRSLDISTLLF